MTNQDTMTLKLSRIEVCDLLIACTAIEWEAREEQAAAETSETRREILNGTIKKWEELHDIIKKQLDEFDGGMNNEK